MACTQNILSLEHPNAKNTHLCEPNPPCDPAFHYYVKCLKDWLPSNDFMSQWTGLARFKRFHAIIILQRGSFNCFLKRKKKKCFKILLLKVKDFAADFQKWIANIKLCSLSDTHEFLHDDYECSRIIVLVYKSFTIIPSLVLGIDFQKPHRNDILCVSNVLWRHFDRFFFLAGI